MDCGGYRVGAREDAARLAVKRLAVGEEQRPSLENCLPIWQPWPTKLLARIARGDLRPLGDDEVRGLDAAADLRDACRLLRIVPRASAAAPSITA